MGITKELLENNGEIQQKKSISKIENILNQNKMTLSVFVTGEEMYSFRAGDGEHKQICRNMNVLKAEAKP